MRIQPAGLPPLPDSQRMIQEFNAEMNQLYDVFAEKVVRDYMVLRQQQVNSFVRNCEENHDSTSMQLAGMKGKIAELDE